MFTILLHYFYDFSYIQLNILTSLNGWYLFSGNLNITSLNYFTTLLIITTIIKARTWLLLLVIYFNLTNAVIEQHIAMVVSQLLVGFNSWHPPLFYASLCLCFLLFFRKELNTFFLRLHIFITTSVTLILGGYWGLGNSIWGYFWVNDSIEMILLFFIVILVITMHLVGNNHVLLLVVSVMICGFIVLLTLRYGLIFTRHSFFNTKKLTNMIFLLFFFFLYYKPTLKFVVLLFSFNLVENHLINFIVLYILIRGYIILLNSKSWIILVHFLIFSNAFLWVKTKMLNIVLFSNKVTKAIALVLISPKSVYVSSIFFLKNALIKTILHSSIFFIYTTKLTLKAIFIFVVYNYTIWVLLTVITWLYFVCM